MSYINQLPTTSTTLSFQISTKNEKTDSDLFNRQMGCKFSSYSERHHLPLEQKEETRASCDITQSGCVPWDPAPLVTSEARSTFLRCPLVTSGSKLSGGCPIVSGLCSKTVFQDTLKNKSDPFTTFLTVQYILNHYYLKYFNIISALHIFMQTPL